MEEAEEVSKQTSFATTMENLLMEEAEEVFILCISNILYYANHEIWDVTSILLTSERFTNCQQKSIHAGSHN